MAIFRLRARDNSVEVVVRANCLSCARSVAASRAGKEGPKVWRNGELSSIELIREPERHGYLSDGKSGLIKRIKHDSKQSTTGS